MNNDFFIKLSKKDEKMMLLKIAIIICVSMLILVPVLNFFGYKNVKDVYNEAFYNNVAISIGILFYLVCFLLENILIIIYLKFRINGEINKFFKLNYMLLILVIGFYIPGAILTISLITNIYRCVKCVKIFSRNKKDFGFSLLGIFITFLSLILFLRIDSYFFKILLLLLGILTILIYQYMKRINKIPSINYLFLFLSEICLLATVLFIEVPVLAVFIFLIFTIIVNLRVIFPKIKQYTSFNKIQKIIIIIGVLFSLFSKAYINIKQKNILEQESNINNLNENATSE